MCFTFIQVLHIKPHFHIPWIKGKRPQNSILIFWNFVVNKWASYMEKNDSQTYYINTDSDTTIKIACFPTKCLDMSRKSMCSKKKKKTVPLSHYQNVQTYWSCFQHITVPFSSHTSNIVSVSYSFLHLSISAHMQIAFGMSNFLALRNLWQKINK